MHSPVTVHEAAREMFIVVCCECGKELRRTVGRGVHPGLSHGLCKRCESRLSEAYRRIKAGQIPEPDMTCRSSSLNVFRDHWDGLD